MLTNSVFQRAFHLIRCIHTDRAVALCVLLDACDRITLIENQQRRRHGYKVTTPKEGLLQFSVYSASEYWEKDQESGCPKKEPIYKPTDDDRLVRYVKALVWKSMDWHSHYGAVGVGCLLYRYDPHQVSGLAEDVFKSDNIRRVKATMLRLLKERFDGPNGLVNGNGELPFETPSAHQRSIIQSSLSSFAPWTRCSPVLFPPSVSLLETYFAESSEKSEWERLHVLFDPACGGFPRLVNEYNSTFVRGNKMRLEDPENKLGSPKFGYSNDPTGNGGDGGPFPNRFNPSPLTSDEISVIKHALEKNERRRNKYQASKLHIFIDGQETLTFDPDSLEPFAVPATSSYLEIFGEDEDGELLLATFPLTCQGIVSDGFDQQISVTGGQRIEASILPVLGNDVASAETDPESAEKLVSLSYSDRSSELKKPILSPAVGAGKAAIVGVGGAGLMIAHQYRILEALGRGSLSTVYKAHDLRNNKLAAIKIFRLKYEDTDRVDDKLKFKQEIGRLAGIKHSGVVNIIDFEGLSESQPYMVMEYVPGLSLRRELGPGGIEFDRIVNLTAQITAALEAIHANGVLHRDIKPENILLHDVEGEVKVKICDFGITRVFEEEFLESKRFTAAHEWGHLYFSEDGGKASKFGINQIAWGSPAYMAPEQLMGEECSVRTDLYSLGVVLYEMMTGQQPFVASSIPELLELKCSEVRASLCDLRPGLPQTAQQVILRALAFDPKERYGSIKELGDAITKALTDEIKPAQAEKLLDKNSKSRRSGFKTGQGSRVSATLTVSERTLEELLHEIALGREAVRELIANTKFKVALTRICERVCSKFLVFIDYSSEDLYQDVCLRLLNSSKYPKREVCEESQFFSWLNTVTRNMVVDSIRRLKVQSRVKRGPLIEPLTAASDVKLVDSHLLMEFKDSLRSLPENHQKVIELWMAGYNYREISRLLKTAGIQCSQETARAWITRVLEDFNSNSLKATKSDQIRPP